MAGKNGIPWQKSQWTALRRKLQRSSKVRTPKNSSGVNKISTVLKTLILVLLAVCCFQPGAFAWTKFGHQVVAGVAYRRLDPKTKERALALLKLNPDYKTWQEKIPADASQADRQMMTFMQAAAWPDEIKLDPKYTSDGGGNKPDKTATDANIGYSDLKLHKYWHFIERHFSTDGSPLPPIVTPNITTEIKLLRAAIASNCPDALKSYDLCWLLHVVGDIHQPMHCVNRISKNVPDGDLVGNLVKVTLTDGMQTNLHALWDRGVDATDKRIEDAVKVADGLPENKEKIGDLHEQDWCDESFGLCREKVYVTPIENGLGPFKVTESYEKTARAIAAQRAELAGIRLAKVLNSELR